MLRKKKQPDVIIAGGGLAGLTAALACASEGFYVEVIEPYPLDHTASLNFDARTSALADASVSLLEQWGIWEHVAPHAGPIWDIRITDGRSPIYVDFHHDAVSDRAMGYIVENRHLRQALLKQAYAHPAITLTSPQRIAAFSAESGAMKVTCEGGETLTTPLLIAADGKRSALREQAGIATKQHDYGQSSLICCLHTEKPHEGVAQERFLPGGPLAVLPMHDPHLVSIVWTEATPLAYHFNALEDEAFLEAVDEKLCGYLGEIALEGPRGIYPLSLTYTTQLVSGRFALIGDAAHAIHPIAGQGFNLGLRDIADLVQALKQAKQLGLDIGSDMVLQQYSDSRQADNLAMIAATDGLNRLFSTHHPLPRLARRAGLAAVQSLPGLKKSFIYYAMGLR